MSKILFLHPNFPAQFKHIATGFAKEGHEVLFLCKTHYGRTIKGVKRICIKSSNSQKNEAALKDGLTEAIYVGYEYRRAMLTLSKTFVPDLIISHSAWGAGLYCKDIWPNTRFIAYCEWWFNSQSDLFTYNSKDNLMGFDEHIIEKFKGRNFPIGMELIESDLIITPTNWQMQQLPLSLQKNCKVIHDGIDIDYFKKEFESSITEKKDHIVVTYGTRGMEAVRCFPKFIKEVVEMLKRYPNIIVEIAGEDSINYGGLKPNKEGSWKKWAIKYIDDNKIEKSKIRWVGRMKFNEYVKWLLKSDLHVYLSHPFVPSWSFLESQALGCDIIASDHKSLTELQISSKVTFVDHTETGFLADQVSKIIQIKKKQEKVINYLNNSECKKYSILNVIKEWAHVSHVDVTTIR